MFGHLQISGQRNECYLRAINIFVHSFVESCASPINVLIAILRDRKEPFCMCCMSVTRFLTLLGQKPSH